MTDRQKDLKWGRGGGIGSEINKKVKTIGEG